MKLAGPAVTSNPEGPSTIRPSILAVVSKSIVAAGPAVKLPLSNSRAPPAATRNIPVPVVCKTPVTEPFPTLVLPAIFKEPVPVIERDPLV